jgi:hypothetical protein
MKLIILILFPLISLSQGEFNNWYFGTNAGISFSSGSPVALTNGSLATIEGCSSISDANGVLQMYTDGVTVWNRNHAVMTNGTGLNGHSSSTQSGLIVKEPNSLNRYWIFTSANDATANGICYSIVDMSLSSGLGSVVTKNIQIRTPSCEKLCAVRHCNNVDIWIVTHDWNSNNFRTWLLTSSGIGTPVLSASGAVITGASQSAYGQLKVNFAGNKLVSATYGFSGTGTNKFELHDFNNQTGVVSNTILLANEQSAYGCEFSPDGKRVYGSTNPGKLIQWNLCAANIPASYTVIANLNPFFGSLQLGPDLKIYCNRNSTSLAVINNPNGLGLACAFQDAAVSLAGRSSRIGLPTFATFYIRARDDWLNTNQCLTVSFTLTLPTTIGCSTQNAPQSILWQFGNGTTSSLQNPVITYASAGSYTVTCTVNYNCYQSIITKTIIISGNSTLITTSISQ